MDYQQQQQQQQQHHHLQHPNKGLITRTAIPLTTAEIIQPTVVPRPLDHFLIYENFDVHDTHRIEDGICTQLTRLPPKKQELLKQFGIQTNQTVTYYEKYIIIENFNRFCNEYKVADHRPFLELQESGLSKSEQLKFVRYLGQGLPNLTLNKLYLAFKDVLGFNRIEKMTIDGYNLESILKRKKKILLSKISSASVTTTTTITTTAATPTVHKDCHKTEINPSSIPASVLTSSIAPIITTSMVNPTINPSPQLLTTYHHETYNT